MRMLLAVIALAGIACVASPAVENRFQFAFTVRVDHASPVTLTATVPPGEHRTLKVNDHLTVDLEVPVGLDDDAVTVVKLIDDSSGKPIVLHTARRSGSIRQMRTFGYAVCGGRTTFESPLSSRPLDCSI